MLEHVAHHRQATGRTRDGCGGSSGGGRVDGWMQAAAAVGRSVGQLSGKHVASRADY